MSLEIRTIIVQTIILAYDLLILTTNLFVFVLLDPMTEEYVLKSCQGSSHKYGQKYYRQLIKLWNCLTVDLGIN